MKKILAFGASNSKNSINKKFATYAAHRIKDAAITVIDLNDFAMPVYGVDRERDEGIPEAAHRFLALLQSHDAYVISLAEHSNNVTVAFKNLEDWTSRIEKKVWQQKPLFLLSTSPGGRGGANVMSIQLKYMPFRGANILAHFSLPSFKENFSETEGITNQELLQSFEQQLQQFEAQF